METKELMKKMENIRKIIENTNIDSAESIVYLIDRLKVESKVLGMDFDPLIENLKDLLKPHKGLVNVDFSKYMPHQAQIYQCIQAFCSNEMKERNKEVFYS